MESPDATDAESIPSKAESGPGSPPASQAFDLRESFEKQMPGSWANPDSTNRLHEVIAIMVMDPVTNNAAVLLIQVRACVRVITPSLAFETPEFGRLD